MIAGGSARRRRASAVGTTPAPEAWEQVARLLADHGLEATPPDTVEALVMAVHRGRLEPGRVQEPPLTNNARQSAITKARALLRYRSAAPRDPATVERARARLIELLGRLSFVVLVAAVTGENTPPVLRRLASRTETANDLAALIAALERLPKMRGGRPPNTMVTPLVPIVRKGVQAWEVCGRSERYTFNESHEPALRGPLVDFLRGVVDLANLPQPTDNTLREHLRKLFRHR